MIKTAIELFPRQHGAWGVLLFSFVAGTAAAGSVGLPGLLLFLAVLAGFLAREPLAVLFGIRRCAIERTKVRRLAAGYLIAAALFGIPAVLLNELWLLIPLGAALMLLGAASLLMEMRRKQFSLMGEIFSICGLTTVAPAAAYAATGEFAGWILGLWVLSALFFCGSVFHVRYLVRNRPQNAGPLPQRVQAGALSVAYHLSALIIVLALTRRELLPAWAALVLVPVAGKALWSVLVRRDTTIPIQRIGQIEVAHGAVFALLTSLAFNFSRIV